MRKPVLRRDTCVRHAWEQQSPTPSNRSALMTLPAPANRSTLVTCANAGRMRSSGLPELKHAGVSHPLGFSSCFLVMSHLEVPLIHIPTRIRHFPCAVWYTVGSFALVSARERGSTVRVYSCPDCTQHCMLQKRSRVHSMRESKIRTDAVYGRCPLLSILCMVICVLLLLCSSSWQVGVGALHQTHDAQVGHSPVATLGEDNRLLDRVAPALDLLRKLYHLRRGVNHKSEEFCLQQQQQQQHSATDERTVFQHRLSSRAVHHTAACGDGEKEDACASESRSRACVAA